MYRFSDSYYAGKVAKSIKIFDFESNESDALDYVNKEYRTFEKNKKLFFRIFMCFFIVHFFSSLLSTEARDFFGFISMVTICSSLISIILFGIFMYLCDEGKRILSSSCRIDDYYGLINFIKEKYGPDHYLKKYLLLRPIKKKDGITDVEMNAIRMLLIEEENKEKV